MPALRSDVQHWRQRAQEARAMAGQITDPESRRRMLNIADQIEKLAADAAARAAAETNRYAPSGGDQGEI
jgi:hypothetical protein